MNDAEIEDARVSYVRGALDETTAGHDPFALFGTWIGDALQHGGIVEPNAMTVATVDGSRRPSARIVLLRGWDERGFVFFTNYDGRKGREIDDQAGVALLFWWGALERQIRIEGDAGRIAPNESDAYFARRPRGHRLSAWASPQSAVVADRAALEAAMAGADARFADVEVPRPQHWGGYRVTPARFEFWQGRPNRVHDRLAFDRIAGGWERQRLAP